MTDSLKEASRLARGSKYIHEHPLAEGVWRRLQGFNDSNAALLRWYDVPGLTPDDNWPTPLPGQEGASRLNMRSWRRDVLAVTIADVVTMQARRQAVGRGVVRIAQAYMLSESVGMVGYAYQFPPIPRSWWGNPNARHQEFLWDLPDGIEGEEAYGVIAGTGPESNNIALGTIIDDDPHTFEALRTYYVGPASAAASAGLLHT